MSENPETKYAALLDAGTTAEPAVKSGERLRRRDPRTGLKEVRKVSIFFEEGDACPLKEAIRPFLRNKSKGWQGALERLILDHTRLKSIPQYGTAVEFSALTAAAQNAQFKVAEQKAKIEEQEAKIEEQATLIAAHAAEIEAHAAQIKVLEGILDRALAAKTGGQS